MPAESYKRGQVEWALWQVFSRSRPNRDPVPLVFLNRIKRLLEIDRVSEKDPDSETPQARCAFYDEVPQGQGSDAVYSAFNAFCLGLGLELLDSGFKQSEVVYFLRHVVHNLEPKFPQVLACPPDSRRVLAKDRPGCPSYDLDGVRIADCRLFMVFRRIELREVDPDPKGRLKHNKPVFTEPIYCWGMEELKRELLRMNFQIRKAMVFELAHMMVLVRSFLEKAPIVKRGRR